MKAKLKKLQIYRIVLIRRIDRLKKEFDFKLNAVKAPTALQEDKLKGLILLCHAEFEDYFESIALELLEIARSEWAEKQSVNYNLLNLLIRGNIPEKKRDAATEIYYIINSHKEVIKNNHGIKDYNLHNMFFPLGYSNNDFDTVFIAALNSFGVERGEIAHTASYKAKTVLDKKTIVLKIDEIKNSIISFEQAILKKL